MTTIEIAIVMDHALFRQGLCRLLEERAELRIVGAGSTGAGTIDLVHRCLPDILLLDLQLNDMNGFDVLRRFPRGIKTKTIILAANIQKEDAVQAILLGACGILEKCATPETLFNSIRSVLNGEVWIKREIVKDLVGMLRGSRRSPAGSSDQFGLTSRELEIVHAVAQGLGNKEISAALGISLCTVKQYLTRVFVKLNVENRVELVLFTARHTLPAAPAPHSTASSLSSRD